ncbi:MAG: CotH kinase family protein [Clostridia bacterium]|nr:CotH kinase family protein [Clostridia bacterium]
MKKAVFIFFVLCFVMAVHVHAENLYDPSVLVPVSGIEGTDGGEIRICCDAAEEEVYLKLPHPAVETLAQGTYCRVEYEISVDEVTGTSCLIPDAWDADSFSQLYTRDRRIPIEEKGTVSGTYYTRASGIPEENRENAVLMNTGLYLAAGSSIKCSIRLAVYETDEISEDIISDICPVGCNLYSNQMLSLKEQYSTANPDGSFTTCVDNLQGEKEVYASFNHRSLAAVIPGETYKVEYQIDTTEAEGECYVVLDSENKSQHSQMFHSDKTVPVRKAGRVSGSFVVTANSDTPEENIRLLMMRSYIYVPVGRKISCTVDVRVSRVKIHTVTVQADDSFSLPGYDTDAHEQGEQIQFRVARDGGKLYQIQVLNAEQDEIDFTYDGNALSFEMPDSDVTVNVQVYRLSYIKDGIEVRMQQIGQAYYLLLPAYADFHALPLTGNLTLRGEKADVRTDEGVPIDLTALFEADMTAGELYELQMFSGDTYIDSVKVMKADCLNTLYISSDVSIDEINKNKETNGKGAVSLVGVDGCVLIDNASMSRFHGRGNTSWTYSNGKKSYTVKLDKKAELIAGAGKAKKWCLITDNCGGEQVDWVHEASGLANFTAYSMYRQIGGAYAIDCEMINLYVNGFYHGTYLLTEKVEIGKNRVNIAETEYEEEDKTYRIQVRPSQDSGENKPKRWDELTSEFVTDDADPGICAGIQAYQYAPGSRVLGVSGGFLLEMDRNFSREASWFVTRRGYPYTLKEPEYATREQVQQIAVYIQGFEDAIYAESGYNRQMKHYTEYLDLNAAAAKLLIECITTQTDTFITSCFMVVDRDFDRIRFGPAWDYDGTNLHTSFSNSVFMSGSAEQGMTNQKEIANKLFSHGELARCVTMMSDTALREAFDAQTPLSMDGNGGMMDVAISRLANSQKMNMLLYPNTENDLNPTDDFAGFKQNFIKRYEKWYSDIFTETALEGLALENHGDYIKAVVTGTADKIAWYRVDAETGEIGQAEISEGMLYYPDTDGIYCAKATGKCIYDSHVDTMYTSIVYEKK